MINKKLSVTIFDKILLLFYNKLLLIGIILIFPLLIVILFSEVVFIRDIWFQLIFGIVLIVAGLIDYLRKTELLKDFYLCNAGVVGKIVHPFHSDKVRRYIVRLTLEFYFENRKLKRHFYIVRRSIIQSEMNFNVLVDRNNPEKFILLISLPRNIRKSIEKL